MGIPHKCSCWVPLPFHLHAASLSHFTTMLPPESGFMRLMVPQGPDLTLKPSQGRGCPNQDGGPIKDKAQRAEKSVFWCTYVTLNKNIISSQTQIHCSVP